MKNAVITVPAYFNDSQRQVCTVFQSVVCWFYVGILIKESRMMKETGNLTVDWIKKCM